MHDFNYKYKMNSPVFRDNIVCFFRGDIRKDLVARTRNVLSKVLKVLKAVSFLSTRVMKVA